MTAPDGDPDATAEQTATSGGVPLTEDALDRLTAEAEAGYPLAKLRPRRHRPATPPDPADVEIRDLYRSVDGLLAGQRTPQDVEQGWAELETRIDQATDNGRPEVPGAS